MDVQVARNIVSSTSTIIAHSVHKPRHRLRIESKVVTGLLTLSARPSLSAQVLRMLRQAQEVMDRGLMTPAEMEAHLVAHLTVRRP